MPDTALDAMASSACAIPRCTLLQLQQTMVYNNIHVKYFMATNYVLE